MIRVTVWNEFYNPHSPTQPELAVYPEGIHEAIASFLRADPSIEARTATLMQPEHGLTEEVLEQTDVLLWWGHITHHMVADEVVERVHKHILAGMGLIVLHSGHASKIFHKLMGTRTVDLRWHEDGLLNRVWVIDPAHPIAEGLDDHFDIPHEETYGEHFDIPTPDQLVFVSWFPSGEVFRSGCCWHRGFGRIFFFQPGHETLPSFYNENVQRVISNAVRWAYRPKRGAYITGETKAL
jgi:trehalose utilization protein